MSVVIRGVDESSTQDSELVIRAGRTRTLVFTMIALVLLVALCGLSLAVGTRPLSLGEVWSGLFQPAETAQSIIVWQLRMPRTVLAIVTGAAIAVAGTVMQALTRNPLAEPGLLGVNAGASFAVVIAIAVLGVSDVRGYVWFAFAGAALATLLVYSMARRSAINAGPTRLVLAGAALGASLSACTGVVTMYNTDAFSSYRFWVIGSLSGRDATVLLWVSPFLAAGLSIALISGHTLNVMSLGEDQARSLGARLAVARACALVGITMLCGAATAAIGPISFVGLVAPHAVRMIIGVDQRRILWCSMLAGPVLMLAADVLGRVVVRPGELEVGVMTALIGGPVLLYLVVRRRRSVIA